MVFRHIIALFKKKIVSIIVIAISVAIVSFSNSIDYRTFNTKEFLNNNNGFNEAFTTCIIDNEIIQKIRVESGILKSENGLFTKQVLDENNMPIFEFRFNDCDKSEAKVLVNRIYLSKNYNSENVNSRAFSFAFFSRECFYFYIYKSESFMDAHDYVYSYSGEYNSTLYGDFYNLFIKNVSSSNKELNSNVIEFLRKSYAIKKNVILLDVFLVSFLTTLLFITTIFFLFFFLGYRFRKNSLLNQCSLFSLFSSILSFIFVKIFRVASIAIPIYISCVFVCFFIFAIATFFLKVKYEKCI